MEASKFPTNLDALRCQGLGNVRSVRVVADNNNILLVQQASDGFLHVPVLRMTLQMPVARFIIVIDGRYRLNCFGQQKPGWRVLDFYAVRRQPTFKRIGEGCVPEQWVGKGKQTRGKKRKKNTKLEANEETPSGRQRGRIGPQ